MRRCTAIHLSRRERTVMIGGIARSTDPTSIGRSCALSWCGAPARPRRVWAGSLFVVSADTSRPPLLLLDIDGVLQPVGRSVPPGFDLLEFDDSIVVLNREHGAWLSELAEDFEVVWASTWAGTANELIGSRLGLPAFAHIDLGTLGTDGTRKLRAVQDFVGDRPFAWVDDELFEDAEVWAAERSAPALLIRTRAYVGLTVDHVEALTAFAPEVTSGDR